MLSARQTYAMLENETLWDVARRCHECLDRSAIPHAVVGGVAVCLHGYRRNTVDVDLLIRGDDAAGVREALENAGWNWLEKHREFRTAEGVAVQFLLAGERAGRGMEARLPDPGDPAAVTFREGLPVLTLAKLIESKLACGMGNLRRTHKDFADVVELIAIHQLSRTFARHLHKSLRPTFRELVLRVRQGE